MSNDIVQPLSGLLCLFCLLYRGLTPTVIQIEPFQGFRLNNNLLGNWDNILLVQLKRYNSLLPPQHYRLPANAYPGMSRGLGTRASEGTL